MKELTNDKGQSPDEVVGVGTGAVADGVGVGPAHPLPTLTHML